jgi:hypothetical protein
MGAWLRRHRHDGIALAALAGLALLFFWPVTLGVAWIPRGGGDLASFLWPTYSYAARSLWSGRIPLWNETLYAGMPFAADNQSGLFYPPNLLAFVLAPSFPYRAIEWLVVFHFWLAGASMYALMRVLIPEPVREGVEKQGRTVSPLLIHHSSFIIHYSSLFAAVAFMFSDVFVTHIGNLNIVAVAAWLPLALACLHLGLMRGSVNWALAAGAVLGVAALAGHAQMMLMSFGAVGLYGLWRSAWSAVRERNTHHALRTMSLLSITLLTAFGLSALALVPAFELTQYTARARLTYAEAALYSVPWPGLAGLVSPLLFGRGAADYWGPWPRVELGYLGVLPLVFAGIALIARRSTTTPHNNSIHPLTQSPGHLTNKGLWAALALLGLLIALGENAPVHRLLYEFVPGFAQLRVPARFLLLTDLGLAVLAGIGFQRVFTIENAERTERRRWFGGLGLVAVATLVIAYLAVAQSEERAMNLVWALVVTLALLCGAYLLSIRYFLSPLAPAFAIALLAADLFFHGAFVEVDFADPTRGFQHPIAVDYLKSRPGPTRIDSTTGAWAPDAAARHGLEDIGGISNPLALAVYQTYLGAMGPRGAPRYDFLGVQWIIAAKDQPPADDPDIVPVFNEDPGVDIWLNTAAQPRLSLKYAALAVPDGESAFAAILAPGFDPVRQVVLETSELLPLPATQPSTFNLYYLHYSPEAHRIAVTTPDPAYLVLSEVWYPGWRAWVNGVEVEVLRANFAFRAVPLAEPGEHVIEMRFEPWTWRLGLGVSAFTAACCIVRGAYRLRRKWKTQHATRPML